MILTGGQIRDARFRAGLELSDLANRSGMDRDRLIYAEAMYGAPAWTEEDFARVRSALEAASVEFHPGERRGRRVSPAGAAGRPVPRPRTAPGAWCRGGAWGGRMLVEFTSGLQDLRPDEAWEVRETVAAVVRSVRDWLDAHPRADA